jgi:hypothetical protein
LRALYAPKTIALNKKCTSGMLPMRRAFGIPEKRSVTHRPNPDALRRSPNTSYRWDFIFPQTSNCVLATVVSDRVSCELCSSYLLNFEF